MQSSWLSKQVFLRQVSHIDKSFLLFQIEVLQTSITKWANTSELWAFTTRLESLQEVYRLRSGQQNFLVRSF